MAWRENAVFGDVEVEGTLTQTGAVTASGALTVGTTLGVTGVATLTGGGVVPDDTTLAFGTGSDGTVEYDEDGTDQVRVAGANWVMPGVQFTPYAATATSDGLTTGLIPLGTSFVAITAAGATDIVTLPAGTAGQVIKAYVGANGCEVRTPATSGATINNVDSDGTNEAAIPATSMFTATCVATDTWLLEAVTELGAVITAIVPDAA